MNLLYKYSNGKEKKHTTFINNKTILKECEKSTTVDIYKIKKQYTTEEISEYITTLLINK